MQIADLAAGGLGAVTEVLAALVGARPHGSRRARERLDDASEPPADRATGSARSRARGLLTGALACYRVYATADGRHLTLGALEPKFFARACELIGRPDLAERQFGDAPG